MTETTTPAESMTSDRMLLTRTLNMLTSILGQPGAYPLWLQEEAGNLWGDLNRRLNSVTEVGPGYEPEAYDADFGIEYEDHGYEDYEPSPYDGTYSEE